MKLSTLSLPKPHTKALRHSELMADIIREDIQQNHGLIALDRFIQHCLYDSTYGYYTSKETIFGADGDFITAPLVSPVFSYCLANQCIELMREYHWSYVLELGAGNGTMAVDILSYMERLQSLPEKYFIYETSERLKEVQRQTFEIHKPHLLDKVVWLDELTGSEPISAVVVANEVLDAVPAKRLSVQDDSLSEVYVGINEQQFIWKNNPLSHELNQFYQTYLTASDLSSGEYDIPISLPEYLTKIKNFLKQGVLIFIDYGFDSKGYSNTANQSDLICHYLHHVHDDPFIYTGIQDISVAVDFRLFNIIAEKIGLHLIGYSTQAHFLMANNLDAIYTQCLYSENEDEIKLAQQAKALTLPDEMGERFKVIALGISEGISMQGFSLINMAGRLCA